MHVYSKMITILTIKLLTNIGSLVTKCQGSEARVLINGEVDGVCCGPMR